MLIRIARFLLEVIAFATALAVAYAITADAMTLEERMNESGFVLPPDAQQVINEMGLTAQVGQDFVNAATGKAEFMIVLYGKGQAILALAIFHYCGAWCSYFEWRDNGIIRWKTYRRKVKTRGGGREPPPFSYPQTGLLNGRLGDIIEKRSQKINLKVIKNL